MKSARVEARLRFSLVGWVALVTVLILSGTWSHAAPGDSETGLYLIKEKKAVSHLVNDEAYKKARGHLEKQPRDYRNYHEFIKALVANPVHLLEAMVYAYQEEKRLGGLEGDKKAEQFAEQLKSAFATLIFSPEEVKKFSDFNTEVVKDKIRDLTEKLFGLSEIKTEHANKIRANNTVVEKLLKDRPDVLAILGLTKERVNPPQQVSPPPLTGEKDDKKDDPRFAEFVDTMQAQCRATVDQFNKAFGGISDAIQNLGKYMEDANRAWWAKIAEQKPENVKPPKEEDSLSKMWDMLKDLFPKQKEQPAEVAAATPSKSSPSPASTGEEDSDDNKPTPAPRQPQPNFTPFEPSAVTSNISEVKENGDVPPANFGHDELYNARKTIAENEPMKSSINNGMFGSNSILGMLGTMGSSLGGAFGSMLSTNPATKIIELTGNLGKVSAGLARIAQSTSLLEETKSELQGKLDALKTALKDKGVVSQEALDEELRLKDEVQKRERAFENSKGQLAQQDPNGQQAASLQQNIEQAKDQLKKVSAAINKVVDRVAKVVAPGLEKQMKDINARLADLRRQKGEFDELETTQKTQLATTIKDFKTQQEQQAMQMASAFQSRGIQPKNGIGIMSGQSSAMPGVNSMAGSPMGMGGMSPQRGPLLNAVQSGALGG
ncbi:MAG: hypothetical protein HY537_02190 [Deltaproteobacteria bacterium]|nr:hypothetical protein [Deltaproteobacteria bacterium]